MPFPFEQITSRHSTLVMIITAALTALILTLTTRGGNRPVAAEEALRCVAFTPYVGNLNPDLGPHPPASLIGALLDGVKDGLGVGCIISYGTINGLEATVPAAKERGIRVIQIVNLDTGGEGSRNQESIAAGIELAISHPETVIRVACGSEIRTKYGGGYDQVIRDCLKQMRAARVIQPLTTIDTWWQFCNESWPCQKWSIVDELNWIGINAFPWWENKYSGIFPCTAAEDAADFHIARMRDVLNRYGKSTMLTEFGWPAGPSGARPVNLRTGDACGEANAANQQIVIQQTFAKLSEQGWSGAAFASFREAFKAQTEPDGVGEYWGICSGAAPFTCPFSLAPAAAAPPATPTLTEPENDARLPQLGATLRWSAPAGVVQYHLQVTPLDNDGPGINLVVGDPAAVAQGSYAIPAPVLGRGPYIMLPGAVYSWRVRTTDKSGSLSQHDPSWGPWSAIRTFKTPRPSAASLTLNPAAPSATPTLSWSDSNPAIFYYEVQVSQDRTFTVDPATATAAVYWNLVHGGISDPLNSWTVPAGVALGSGAAYHWRVRPRVQASPLGADEPGVAWTAPQSLSVP